MRFQVSHLLKQPLGHETQWELREAHLYLDKDTVLSGLSGTITILRTDGGLLVFLKATYTIKEACSRCLTPVDHSLALEFQEEYLATVDVLTGTPIPIPEDADNFLIDTDFSLELDEALRQYKVIGEPAKPLCRPRCRGLCPNCGHNLNLGPCSCPQERDSRWQALAGLAEALKEKES